MTESELHDQGDPPTGQVDDVGIVHRAPTDRAWPTVPADALESVLSSASTEELVDAIIGEGGLSWPAELQRRLLHPSGAIAATVAPVRSGMRALDLGTGWSTLGSALSSLGAEVVSADWIYPRLRFAQLMYEPTPAQAVYLDPTAPLPWPDRSFNLIYMDLDQLSRCEDREGSNAGKNVVAEVRRLLTRGGVAIVGVSNPLPRIRREGSPGSRSVPNLIGEVAKALGPRSMRPWWDPALRRSGLAPRRVVIPIAQPDGSRKLIPREGLRAYLEPGIRGSSLKRRAKRTAVRFGLGTILVDEYLVVVQRRGETRMSHTLADELVGRGGVTFSLSDARVAMEHGDTFVKFPLSRSQQEALVTEVNKTQLARDTPFAPHIVPRARLERWETIPFSRFPRVSAEPASLDEVERALHLILGSPLVHQHVDRLDTTDLWARLKSSRGRRDAEELGVSELHHLVVEQCGAAVVPIGATHGDLHLDNVLIPADGPPLLVDWNRFELCNPLLLDHLYAAARLHEARRGQSFAAALLDFSDRELEGELVEGAMLACGALTPLEAATVLFLDRVTSYSQPRRRYKPWTMPALREGGDLLARRWAAESRG